MRKILFPVLLCFLFSFVACREKQRGIDRNGLALHIDTADAKTTYLSIKQLNQVSIDSIYKGLLTSLDDSNKYDLLSKHLFYYKQIAGKGKAERATISKSEGLIYNFFSKYDSSKCFFDNAIALYNELNLRKDIADCCYDQATNYFLEGSYAQAFIYNYKALAIYEQMNDSNNIYKVKTEIGDDYLHEREYDSAVTILLPCRSYFLKNADNTEETYTESLLGQAYYHKMDFQTSLYYAQSSLATRRRIGDKLGISGSLNNIASVYLELKQWDKALSGFNESLDILRQLNDVRQIPIIKENIANCIWHMGDTKAAEQILLGVIDTAKQKKQELLLAHAYMLLYNFNKGTQNYKAAMTALELYKAHNDTLFNIEKSKIISELSIKYEIKNKEARIAELNADKKLDGLKKLSYLLILFFTGLIAVLIILLLANRNKKNKLILEKVKLELEAQALELTANTRELQHFTESVISKNKVIEDLELKLRDKIRETTFDENSEQLSQLYQLKILTEDDWRQFKILFDKVYPGFISKLRERFPDLSPSEERQSLLIKLKIDNKESADMLGISILSIKKNRYRLKKRFNLPESEDLDEFVWKFI